MSEVAARARTRRRRRGRGARNAASDSPPSGTNSESPRPTAPRAKRARRRSVAPRRRRNRSKSLSARRSRPEDRSTRPLRRRVNGLATTDATSAVACTAALVAAACVRPRSVRGTSERPSRSRERLAAVCPCRRRISTTRAERRSPHEECRPLVATNDDVGWLAVDAVDLGGRERQMASGARPPHEPGRADATESCPQLFIERG